MAKGAALRPGRVATVMTVVGPVVAVGAYLTIAALRIRHPFELQWIEGATTHQVRRVLTGEPLYASPSVTFVGLPYPPLYPWTAAAVARLTGVGFFPLRLVSLASSIGTLALLALLVRSETRDWVAALAASGLYAAAFRLAGAWYDVGRADSLFVLLVLTGLAVVRRAETAQAGVAAGVLLALAFLTKQSALLVVLPVAGYLLVRRRRAGVGLVVAFLLPVAVSTVVLDLASDGWYRFFLAGSLSAHPIEAPAWIRFWTRDLARLVLVPVLVALGALVARRNQRELNAGFYLAAGGGLVAAAWISRLHSGGYANVLMPAVAAAALVFGLAVHHLRRGPAWRRAATVLAVLAQFALLAYDPRAQLPTPTDRDAGFRLLAALRAVPGEVFVVSHPWYGVMAGKPPTAHAAAIGDLIRGDNVRAADLTRAALAEAVRSKRFGAILFDETSEDRRGFPDDFEDHYRRIADPVFSPGSSGLIPVTDLRIRPRSWWVPR